MSATKLPILFIIFNRRRNSIKAFESIRSYQPERLYIAADGPRRDKDGEDALCEETRQALLSVIDWDCEIHKLFRDKNLGCAQAVYEGVTWFFEHEEYGIIIEDDILLSQDFYKMCEVLLPLYKDDKRVMQIAAHNPRMDYSETNEYTFSNVIHIWGWASWRRAWNLMDMNMSKWPQTSKFRIIRTYGLFHGLIRWLLYWNRTYHHIEESNSWATRWYFCCFFHHGLSLCAKVNLMKNIGTDGGAHYTEYDTDPYQNLSIGTLRFPLKIKENVQVDHEQYIIDKKDFFRMRLLGLKKKIRIVMNKYVWSKHIEEKR